MLKPKGLHSNCLLGRTFRANISLGLAPQKHSRNNNSVLGQQSATTKFCAGWRHGKGFPNQSGYDLSAPWPPLPGTDTFSTAKADAFIWDSLLASNWHLVTIRSYQSGLFTCLSHPYVRQRSDPHRGHHFDSPSTSLFSLPCAIPTTQLAASTSRALPHPDVFSPLHPHVLNL